MKKKLIVIILALVLLFTGCTNKDNKETRDVSSNGDVQVWTDTETGVQYIIYSHKDGYAGMGGITPRLNVDGSLYTEIN